jgi:hypothetical protein
VAFCANNRKDVIKQRALIGALQSFVEAVMSTRRYTRQAEWLAGKTRSYDIKVWNQGIQESSTTKSISCAGDESDIAKRHVAKILRIGHAG